MPVAGAAAWCLTIASLVGRSSGIEDAAALIQQRQAVSALESSSSLQATSRALPDPGSDGVRMSRLSATGEAGSIIFKNYSYFCEQEDSFGPKECALYFGMPFHTTYKVRLSNGLSIGDVLFQSTAVSLQHNTSNLWSFLVPSNFHVESSCGLCASSCDYKTVNPKYSLNVTVPTFLEGMDMCNGTATQEEFVISNQSSFWFKPAAGLSLAGNVTTSTAVFDSNGNTRVQAAYVYRMSNTPPLAMLAASPDGAPSAGGLPAEVSMGPMDLLGQALFGTLDEAAEVLKSRRAADPGVVLSETALSTSSQHALVLNLTVRGLAAGNSISFQSDKNCTSTDSSGSIACLIPFNETVNFTSDVNISFTAQEGSTLYTSSKLNVGGSLETLFPNKFKKKEVNVPFCGNQSVVVTDMKGLSHNYKPGKCGLYALSFANRGEELQKMAEFANFDLPRVFFMPFLPRTFDGLLPLSSTSELEIKREDGSTVVSLEFAIGISLVG
mmetsp:Transcript_102502/g.319381  ORF Transcript_102502/g.319381 Transcript_102502/m.319381 type:complete len:496 (+) Transcript_102502:56-1543(+)